MAEPATRFFDRVYEAPSGKIAILTMDNGLDYKKPNTFSESAFRSLNDALDRILAHGDVKGMMLTGKPYIFAAGADLSEVPGINTFDRGYRVGQFGHTVLKRIMDLPFPTVAAINGVALGGGLEIALYCSARTVAANVQAIGFPECFLGLVPGWGGCTLTTRLLGPEKALQIIIYNALNQNRMLTGPQAFQAGLADRIFGGVEFLDESLLFLQDVMSGRVRIERGEPPAGESAEVFAKARSFVDGKIHRAAPAPYRAIELIEGARSRTIEEGFEEENKALGDLIKSRQCKASVYSFDLVSRHAKKPKGVPDVKPNSVRKVGIIGAGLMASQLAQLFIHKLGVPVVMKDVRRELVDAGCARVRQAFATMAEKGKLPESRARYLSGLLEGTLDYAGFADCDFVIEAVFERMDVKKQVLAEAEEHMRPDAVLATNTSSLSVNGMAADLRHPERVVGFHFFNPVAVLPLVEIIGTVRSDGVSVATTFGLAKALGKTAILVKDSPAFLVNRVLLRMLVDCLSVVDEGAAFQQVDEAMLALGLPMAPFDLLAMVGLPVALHVMETLNRAFGPERFALNENLARLPAAGKTGVYVPGSEPRRVDPEVEAHWKKSGQRVFRIEEIQERVLANLARETDLILREKVVDSARDVDLAMIMGAGWPFFLGGITMYLDLVGITPKVLQKVFFSF